MYVEHSKNLNWIKTQLNRNVIDDDDIWEAQVLWGRKDEGDEVGFFVVEDDEETFFEGEPVIWVSELLEMEVEEIIALGDLRNVREVEPLIAMLEDSDADVRWASAKALGDIGDVRAVEPLISRLEDPDADVRWAAAHALGGLGDVRAVEPLIPLLKDSDSYVSRTAVWALRDIGDVRAVEPLIALLEDPRSDVRAAARLVLNEKKGEISGVVLVNDDNFKD